MALGPKSKIEEQRLENWRPKNGSIPSRNKKEEAIWKGVTDRNPDRQTESIVDNNDS